MILNCDSSVINPAVEHSRQSFLLSLLRMGILMLKMMADIGHD